MLGREGEKERERERKRAREKECHPDGWKQTSPGDQTLGLVLLLHIRTYRGVWN